MTDTLNDLSNHKWDTSKYVTLEARPCCKELAELRKANCGEITENDIHEIARGAIMEFLPDDARKDALGSKDFTRRNMIDIGHAVAKAIAEHSPKRESGERERIMKILNDVLSLYDNPGDDRIQRGIIDTINEIITQIEDGGSNDK